MSDFTNTVESFGVFTTFELDEGVDFIATGDGETITVGGSGYGDGGYGDGGYGGSLTITTGYPTTIWTNIDTP